MPINPPAAPPKITPKTTSTRVQSKTAAQETEAQKLREQSLGEVFLMGAGVLTMFGQWADAGTLRKFGPPLAHETVALANTYPKIIPILDWLAQATPVASIAGVLMPVVLQFMANHGKIDANRVATVGVVPPEMLAAEMQAEIMSLQAEAIRKQRMAHDDLMRAHQEFAQAQAGDQAEPATP